jgi:hypothetical protein
MLRKLFTLRFGILLLCCMGVVGGLGCATIGALEHRAPTVNVEAKESMKDEIIAFALPDTNLAAKLGTHDAVAFLGRKHTYLLSQGGSHLTNVAAQLDAERLKIEEVPQALFVKDRIVWGRLRMSYTVSKDPQQAATERETLTKLGFGKTTREICTMELVVNGAVHPSIKLSDAQAARLKHTRKITFYAPPHSYRPPDIAKVFLVPLGVAADILLIPVYFLVLISL